MSHIYLIAHKSGYNGVKEYIAGIYDYLSQQNHIEIIIYNTSNDIPLPYSKRKHQRIYIFIGQICPKYYVMYVKKKYKYIFFVNTEQTSRTLCSDIIHEYISNKLTIYDYDRYQAKYNHSHYLPYLMTNDENKYLQSLITQTTKKYDVAICSINGSTHRQFIINQLKSCGVSVIDVVGWDNHRDEQIASAKILINIHFDTDYTIFEHLRCDRWILSGMLVVSESSDSDQMLDCTNLLLICRYEQMIVEILNILSNYDKYYTKYLSILNDKKNNIISRRRTYYDELK